MSTHDVTVTVPADVTEMQVIAALHAAGIAAEENPVMLIWNSYDSSETLHRSVASFASDCHYGLAEQLYVLAGSLAGDAESDDGNWLEAVEEHRARAGAEFVQLMSARIATPGLAVAGLRDQDPRRPMFAFAGATVLGAISRRGRYDNEVALGEAATADGKVVQVIVNDDDEIVARVDR